jgi:hypothetical protein
MGGWPDSGDDNNRPTGAVLCIVMGILCPAFGLGIIFTLIMYFGDAPSGERTEPARFDIAKVVMHEPGRYTVFEINGNTYQERTFNRVTLVKDAPLGEPSYVEYTKCLQKGWRSGQWRDAGYQRDTPVYIHIHDMSVLGGAGWDHGKFGSGQTTVVE